MSLRTVCSYTPRELFESFGLEAPRLIPFGTVSSESRGEALSGPGVCSWCKSALGSVETGEVWYGGATCDQMRRMFEIAGRVSGARPVVICVPKTRTPQAEDFFVSEIRWLAGEIGRRAGRAFDPEALRQSIVKRNELRKRIRELRPSLCGSELTALVHLEARLSVEEMTARLEAWPISGRSRPGIPVLLAGSPSAISETGGLRLMEEAGLSLVADATCTGDRAVDFEIGPEAVTGEDPLDALARSYFHRPPCLFVRPNDAFYEYARRLAGRRGARAVVWRSLRGCDICGLEARRAERILGLPLLSLDFSYGDGESLRVRNRLEAFAESLS